MSELKELAAARIAAIEEFLGLNVLEERRLFGLGYYEDHLLRLLAKHEIVTRLMAYNALYAIRPEIDQPHEKIIDVWIVKLRRKLKPYGVTISTQWGQGWYLAPEEKNRVRSYIINRRRRVAA